jgi:FkbM family methyltransferase
VRFVKAIHDVIRTNQTLGRLALAAIPDVGWRINVRNVGPMHIRLRRNRSYWLRDPLVNEAFMVTAMRRLTHPGDIVFDVGANIGLFVRLSIQQFCAGRVIAFEPASQNQVLLYQNIHLGNCEDRVQVVRMALADYDGSDEFQIDDVSTATGTLNVVTRGKPSQARQQYGFPPATETVTVARLDTLMECGALPVPQVIKVDIEGAEERLLRGAARTLERHKPRLVIELHGDEVSRAVVRFLSQLGYSIFGFLGTDKGMIYKEILASDIDNIIGPSSLYNCIADHDRNLMIAPINLQL